MSCGGRPRRAVAGHGARGGEPRQAVAAVRGADSGAAAWAWIHRGSDLWARPWPPLLGRRVSVGGLPRAKICQAGSSRSRQGRRHLVHERLMSSIRSGGKPAIGYCQGRRWRRCLRRSLPEGIVVEMFKATLCYLRGNPRSVDRMTAALWCRFPPWGCHSWRCTRARGTRGQRLWWSGASSFPLKVADLGGVVLLRLVV